MNVKRLRTIASTTLLSLSLFAGSVAPVAATPRAIEAHPFECYYNGSYYPVGTKLAAGPLFYRQCELEWGDSAYGPQKLTAIWRIYERQ